MTMTWEDTQLVFPILRERAIREQTCFCKCGCREAGVSPVNRFGTIEPGVCATCKKARNWRMHERASSAAYIYRDADDEAEEAKPEPRRISADEREAAMAYLRNYGEGGTALVERLRERIEKGEPLTDAQVRSALRSEAADERHARRVMKRVEKRGKVRASIPETMRAGYYAVEGGSGWVLIKLDRPSRGPMRGWVIVSASADRNMVEVGSQRPRSRLDALLRVEPVYQGKMTHAIATLVRNPTKASADYKEMIGGMDD